MHKLAEKMAECLKVKVEGMGIDNIEGEHLIELGMWVDIIKDIAEYDKAMREIEEMDEESEDGEDDGRRGYRGQPRDSMGRFRSRRGRRGGRMGYEEPMYFRMTPEMYREHSPEYWRDMDREQMGRMYYDGGTSGSTGDSTSGRSGQSSGGSQGGMSGGSSSGGGTRGYEENYGNRGGNQGGRDSREGRSGQSRRGYMESKEMGKDKQEKMKHLEEYMKELGTDVTEMIEGASPEEKNMLKTKMQTLLQKIQ